MRNLYTCDNCIFNPSQYQEVGSRTGFCLRHDTLLFNPSQTTCSGFQRKDLPSFLSEEGHSEHRAHFRETRGVVHYYSRAPVEQRRYSARHRWNLRDFDPYLHEIAIYHRTVKKWTYLQAFLSSRNPIKSIMHSCLVRRYISHCGPQKDNYELVLSATTDLAEPIDLRITDFRISVSQDEFEVARDIYAKDIVLLRLYLVQEYGALIQDEHIMWISDELNGAIEASWREFAVAAQRLAPAIVDYIIRSAETRGTFFPTHGTGLANEDDVGGADNQGQSGEGRPRR